MDGVISFDKLILDIRYLCGYFFITMRQALSDMTQVLMR